MNATIRDMREERHQSPRPPLPGRNVEYIDIRGQLRVPVDVLVELLEVV